MEKYKQFNSSKIAFNSHNYTYVDDGC